MTVVRIGDVTLEAHTWNPSTSSSREAFRYIDISGVEPSDKIIREARLVLPTDAPGRARQLVETGDVLVSTVRPNLNAVAQVPATLNGATASTGFTVLRSDPARVDGRYLFHFVRTVRFVRAIVSRATGASYPAVSDRIVRQTTIPLPPLAEQHRIAVLLDKVDDVRRKRRESLRLVDDLMRSVFLEMFGDPVLNENGWPAASLDGVAAIVSGVTKGRTLRGQSLRFVPYIRVANVQDGYLDLSIIKKIEATDSELLQYRLEPGDVLLTEGGDPDKLGRGAVWRGEIVDCIHQNHIFRVRLHDDRLTPDFVSALLASAYGKRYFLRAAKQTTGIASINRTQLGQFPVLVPPTSIQQRFAATWMQAHDLAAAVEAAATESDLLSAALAERLFSGPE